MRSKGMWSSNPEIDFVMRRVDIVGRKFSVDLSFFSACHVSRHTTCLCSRYLFKDVCTANHLGKQR